MCFGVIVLWWHISRIRQSRACSLRLKKDCPKLTEMLPVLAVMFRSKDEEFVDALRIEFINITPCTQEWNLKQSLIAWRSLREELKVRGNEQGQQECLASLKRLLSGLPKIKTLLEQAEFTLQTKVSFDRMLMLAENCNSAALAT